MFVQRGELAVGSSGCILPRSGVKILALLQENNRYTKPPPCGGGVTPGSQVSGTPGVSLRGDLVALESRLVFLTYCMEATGASSAVCNLLKSLMWLLRYEEEETSVVLAQVAVAPLAKKCSSQELPREIIVGKQSGEGAHSG